MNTKELFLDFPIVREYRYLGMTICSSTKKTWKRCQDAMKEKLGQMSGLVKQGHIVDSKLTLLVYRTFAESIFRYYAAPLLAAGLIDTDEA